MTEFSAATGNAAAHRTETGPEPSANAATSAPPVSVIMPVRAEERNLADSVRHVLGQDYAGPIELVLAIGPSKDRTAVIADQLAAAEPRITIVANPSGQIPAALNVAVRAARHDIVVRVDARSRLPVSYISTAVRMLEETGAVNVGGIQAAEGITPFQRAVAWAMTSPFGVGSARFHTGGTAGPSDSVYLGAFRRAAIEGVGGYDEQYLRAEDWELNHRIGLTGGLIWFEPELRVTYRPRTRLPELASQYFLLGRWRRVVARRHAGTINARYLAPPAALVANTIGLGCGVAGLAGTAAGAAGSWPEVLLAGFAVPGLYLAGLLAISATATGELRGRSLAWLPAVIGTMHMCWGAGFLTSSRRLAR